MNNTSVSFGGAWYPVIGKGRGRAFVFTPDGALLGCVENTGGRWRAQPIASADYIGNARPTRAEAAVALVRHCLAEEQRATE